MKAETQANSLASLVEKKKQYPEYELVFPLFKVKHSVVNKLSEGDVFLLGMQSLNLCLLSKDTCAKVACIIEEGKAKIKILYLEKDTLEQAHTKKYQNVKISFGMLQCRKFEVGYQVNIAQLNLEEVELFVDEENIANGILVKVDDEIAIEIKKVKKDEK